MTGRLPLKDAVISWPFQRRVIRRPLKDVITAGLFENAVISAPLEDAPAYRAPLGVCGAAVDRRAALRVDVHREEMEFELQRDSP